MATFSKVVLSGSTNGKGIKLANTATTIHATGTSSTIIDELWLYVVNTSSSVVVCTLTYGGSTDPDNYIEQSIRAESGLYLLLPGLILTGTGSAANTLSGFGATTNVLVAYGYVNRINP